MALSKNIAALTDSGTGSKSSTTTKTNTTTSKTGTTSGSTTNKTNTSSTTNKNTGITSTSTNKTSTTATKTSAPTQTATTSAAATKTTTTPSSAIKATTAIPVTDSGTGNKSATTKTTTTTPTTTKTATKTTTTTPTTTKTTTTTPTTTKTATTTPTTVTVTKPSTTSSTASNKTTTATLVSDSGTGTTTAKKNTDTAVNQNKNTGSNIVTTKNIQPIRNDDLVVGTSNSSSTPTVVKPSQTNTGTTVNKNVSTAVTDSGTGGSTKSGTSVLEQDLLNKLGKTNTVETPATDSAFDKAKNFLSDKTAEETSTIVKNQNSTPITTPDADLPLGKLAQEIASVEANHQSINDKTEAQAKEAINQQINDYLASNPDVVQAIVEGEFNGVTNNTGKDSGANGQPANNDGEKQIENLNNLIVNAGNNTSTTGTPTSNAETTTQQAQQPETKASESITVSETTRPTTYTEEAYKAWLDTAEQLLAKIDQGYDDAQAYLEQASQIAIDAATMSVEKAKEESKLSYEQQKAYQEYLKNVARDNRMLLNTANGNLGGIGQAQYSAEQAEFDSQLLDINLSIIQLENDAAYQIAQLEAEGQYELAQQIASLKIQKMSDYIDQYNTISNMRANYAQAIDSLNLSITSQERSAVIDKINAGITVTAADMAQFGLSGSDAQTAADNINYSQGVERQILASELANYNNSSSSNSNASSSSQSGDDVTTYWGAGVPYKVASQAEVDMDSNNGLVVFDTNGNSVQVFFGADNVTPTRTFQKGDSFVSNYDGKTYVYNGQQFIPESQYSATNSSGNTNQQGNTNSKTGVAINQELQQAYQDALTQLDAYTVELYDKYGDNDLAVYRLSRAIPSGDYDTLQTILSRDEYNKLVQYANNANTYRLALQNKALVN